MKADLLVRLRHPFGYFSRALRCESADAIEELLKTVQNLIVQNTELDNQVAKHRSALASVKVAIDHAYFEERQYEVPVEEETPAGAA
jgi:hypothetical protein